MSAQINGTHIQARFIAACFFIVFCLCNASLFGQFHHDILPNLTGAALENGLQDNYKPTNVLLYGPARDTLFSRVYLEKDSVVCIYSDHKVFLPVGADPTQAVFMNGAANGINTEHTYPQSKGADEANGNPYSDMHHLYPSRVAVNEARADFPFQEIPDANTTKWFYRNQTVTSQPAASAKPLYSEFRSGAFEVRESQKGNIARAMFYFYTMYRTEAINADPFFFEAQANTLCAWHYLDPVDSLEYARTFKIAKYQSNKPNPFVLDCSLAERTYCSSTAQACPNLPTVASSEPKVDPIALSVYPNPSSQEFVVSMNLPKAQKITITIYQTDGSEAHTLYEGIVPAEKWEQYFTHRGQGVYMLSVSNAKGLLSQRKLVFSEK
jgi:hypothetical protein